MEIALNDKMKKEINKNDEKMDEIEDSHEMTKGGDVRMMDNEDEEIVFEKDRAGTKTTRFGTDKSNNLLHSSSPTGALGSSNG